LGLLVFSDCSNGRKVSFFFTHRKVNACMKLILFVSKDSVLVIVRELIYFEDLSLFVCWVVLILLCERLNTHVNQHFHEVVVSPKLSPKKFNTFEHSFFILLVKLFCIFSSVWIF